jgi:hypothetical protein
MFPARIPIVSSPPSGLQNTYSLSFDGSDDYVNCGTGSELGLASTDMTLSAWAFKTGSSGGMDFASRDNSYYFAYDNTTGKLRSIWYGGGFQYGYSNEITIGDYEDGWHLFMWVHTDGTNDKFYIDGSSVGTDTNTNNLDGDGVEKFRIGDGNIDNFDGKLDEVAIWNTALSDGSISTIYNSGVPTDLLADSNAGSLQGWWRFEEGSGTSATDSSANSNTGTLTNGPAYSTDIPS